MVAFFITGAPVPSSATTVTVLRFLRRGWQVGTQRRVSQVHVRLDVEKRVRGVEVHDLKDLVELVIILSHQSEVNDRSAAGSGLAGDGKDPGPASGGQALYQAGWRTSHRFRTA